MNLPLKTTNRLINELGECTPLSRDVKLLGPEKLIDRVSKRLRSSVPKTETFEAVFGLDNKFFYRIDKVTGDDMKTLAYEIGTGHLEKDNDGSMVLVRDTPRVSKLQDQEKLYFNEVHVPAFQDCTPEDYLIVSYMQLPDLNGLFVDPNTLLYSDVNACPSVLYIDNNSFITKTPEKGITNVSAQALDEVHGFSDSVVKSIRQHTKNLILQSPNIAVKSLTFKAVKQCKVEKPGTVFFDKESKTLKCYDGTTWRTLSYEDT
tara:strand:- start:2049 stop:2831 length:783 start_codon:yes stop_codon:yes gene_type:complete